MQTKQAKAPTLKPATKTAEPTQKTAHSAGSSMRLPAWTNAWGDHPPARLFPQEVSNMPGLQAKLTVSQPDDPFEQEADQVAEQVMRTPAPGTSAIQGPSSFMRKENASTGTAQSVPPVVSSVLNSGGGHPLVAGTRSFMESRFGHDFSQVRVHTDTQAAESARTIGARAYTLDKNIVFGVGQYKPETREGQQLLAHELAHVIQQNTTLKKKRVQRQLVTPLGPGGGFGGLMDRDRQAAAQRWLNFYHGTRWSIAQKIKDIEPIGRGDFAGGFYTHYDTDDRKAFERAKKWAIIQANTKPPEPYAGVITFKVQEVDYRSLLGNSKIFDLTSSDQPDYKEKQKQWLDFITTYGREKEPTFRKGTQERPPEWAHEIRGKPGEPQPSVGYNIIKGPFYRPLRGTEERKPKPEEFKPYSEGTELPHQVLWAEEGIKLLNSPRVVRELQRFDARPDDGDRPHDASSAQPITEKQIIEKYKDLDIRYKVVLDDFSTAFEAVIIVLEEVGNELLTHKQAQLDRDKQIAGIIARHPALRKHRKVIERAMEQSVQIGKAANQLGKARYDQVVALLRSQKRMLEAAASAQAAKYLQEGQARDLADLATGRKSGFQYEKIDLELKELEKVDYQKLADENIDWFVNQAGTLK